MVYIYRFNGPNRLINGPNGEAGRPDGLPSNGSPVAEPTISLGQMNYLFKVRTLWREMATWTRAYLISRFAGQEIAEDVFQRLYRLPREFGDLMRLVYTDQIAEQYIQIISSQLVLTKEIIDAEIAGNTDLVNEKVRELYERTEGRSEFIASINPYWHEDDVRNLINTYHQYTLEEITTLLTGDYARNIDIYDRLLQHADLIGDYFVQGLYNYLAYGPIHQ
jgi:hypothetical protein